MAQKTEFQVGTPQNRRYLTVLVVLTFLGIFFTAFDATAPNVALPVIMRALHMSTTMGGTMVGVGFLGTVVLGLAAGPLMDRMGRKSTFRLVLLGTAVFSAITALVGNVGQLLLIRFFAGSSLVTIQTGGVLVSEEMPARRRGLMVGLIQAAVPCGNITLSLVAAALLPSGAWRVLFLLTFIPAIVIILLAGRYLREPPRSRQALDIKRGGVASSSTQVAAINVSEAKKSEWRQLLDPSLRRQAILSSLFAMLVNSGVGFVLGLGVTFLALYDHLPIGLAALGLLFISIGGLVGQIAAGLLGDHFAARNILIGFALVGGVSVALLSIAGHFSWVIVPLLGAGVFGQGILGVLPRYAADSFPTRARGTGTSTVIAMYWIGEVFMPPIFGSLMGGATIWLAPLVAGALMVVGALLLLGARKIAPKQELETIVT